MGNHGEPVQASKHIFDAVIVRGLKIDRSANGSEHDYHVFKDSEDMGVVVYTPLRVTDSENFVDPVKNKTIYDDTRLAVGRVLMKFKGPSVLKVFTKEGYEVKIDETLNTWQHLAIFETDLIPPEFFKSRYRLEGMQEWLTKWKPGKWMMVDMDNWMLGNPLIQSDNTHDHYKDDVFKGTALDPEDNIDLRNV